MRNSDRSRDVLQRLLEQLIASSPFEYRGRLWVAATQEEFCATLGPGWSVSKFYRHTSVAPFVRITAKIDGAKKTLLRLGDPEPVTSADTAKHMSNLLRRYRANSRKALLTERESLTETTSVPEQDALREVRVEKIDHLLEVLPTLTTPDEFGCMCGLAEIWPKGHQVDILRSILSDWPAFMAGEKVAIWRRGEGQERYFDFPSMKVIRAFPDVGLELYVMERQEEAEEITQELRELSRLIENDRMQSLPLI